ncbi:carboxymuconolactone decarboxylase family protein [Deltaproteobacteria bacterium PRO3]|nr:carboxymuconolactone decarboxylase family protein [Deltaproteobacteria bacterium PRO3]
MARLPDPTAALDPEARKLYDAMAAKRGRIDGMYGAMFNHPALVEHVADLGTYLRFGATLPGEIRELAILLAARRLGVPYEWVKHVPPAEAAGLSAELLEAIRQERELGAFSPLYPKVAQAVSTVLAQQSLPADLQAGLEQELGLKGVLELVILVGFYRMISAFIRAFDVPLPADARQPF